MGLFKNDSKLCPICGEPTERILPKKVDDVVICKKCYAKIDVPDSTLKSMSFEDLKYYFIYHTQNRSLADIFTESYKYDISSGTGAAIILDTANRLVRFSEDPDKLVFRMDDIASFKICEGDDVLYEGSPKGFLEHESGALDHAGNLSLDIVKFNAEKAAYQQKKADYEAAKARGEKPAAVFAPHFSKSPKFSEYYIVFQLKDHEFYSSYTLRESAPSFDSESHSIAKYTSDYQVSTREMRKLASELMAGLWNIPVKEAEEEAAPADKPPVIFMNPKPADPAPAAAPAPQAPPAPPVNVADEIKKFKELLDMGAITQEEYDAKKKQLLGL